MSLRLPSKTPSKNNRPSGSHRPRPDHNLAHRALTPLEKRIGFDITLALDIEEFRLGLENGPDEADVTAWALAVLDEVTADPTWTWA